MGAEKSIRDMTDEEVCVREAVRSVDTVARGLERLANRLREIANRYESVGSSTNKHVALSGCVGVAAEVVNEFTQGVGNNGTHIWQVIRSAQAVDDFRRAGELRGED
jgi:hypothetical protein